MMTLDECVDRCRLPIVVKFCPIAELWGIESLDKNAPGHGHWWGDAESATQDYLEAVRSLS